MAVSHRPLRGISPAFEKAGQNTGTPPVQIKKEFAVKANSFFLSKCFS